MNPGLEGRTSRVSRASRVQKRKSVADKKDKEEKKNAVRAVEDLEQQTKSNEAVIKALEEDIDQLTAEHGKRMTQLVLQVKNVFCENASLVDLLHEHSCAQQSLHSRIAVLREKVAYNRLQLAQYFVPFHDTANVAIHPSEILTERMLARVQVVEERDDDQADEQEEEAEVAPEHSRIPDIELSPVTKYHFRLKAHSKELMKLKVKAFDPGEVVFREGSEGDRMYYIACGAVNIVRDNVVLAHLLEGDIFGELATLFDMNRTVTVVACLPTKCHLLSNRMYYGGFGKRCPVIAEVIKRLAVERLGHHITSYSLKKVPAMKDLQALPVFEVILRKLGIRHVAKGTDLIKQGRTTSTMYFVARGELRGFHEDILVKECKEGDHVAASEAIFGTTSPITVRVVGRACELIEIPKQLVSMLSAACPKFLHAVEEECKAFNSHIATFREFNKRVPTFVSIRRRPQIHYWLTSHSHRYMAETTSYMDMSQYVSGTIFTVVLGLAKVVSHHSSHAKVINPGESFHWVNPESGGVLVARSSVVYYILKDDMEEMRRTFPFEADEYTDAAYVKPNLLPGCSSEGAKLELTSLTEELKKLEEECSGVRQPRPPSVVAMQEEMAHSKRFERQRYASATLGVPMLRLESPHADTV